MYSVATLFTADPISHHRAGLHNKLLFKKKKICICNDCVENKNLVSLQPAGKQQLRFEWPQPSQWVITSKMTL